MNIKYCCPSYDRPTSCPVLDYLDRVKNVCFKTRL